MTAPPMHAEDQSLKARDIGELGELVTEGMCRLGIPGVAVGLVHGDQEHLAGFGVTNVEHPLPVDSDTLFSIGSVTKPVAATALLRLLSGGVPGAGDGLGNPLDLEATARTYVPELRLADESAAARVTVRHLLEHTGGWAGYPMDWVGPGDSGDDALAAAMPRMVVLPQLAPPGELFAYSNNGYVVAGRILEVLTGEPFEASMARLVLAPLGMTRSFFSARRAISHRVAVSHDVRRGRATVHGSEPWGVHAVFNPAGGLASSVRDVLGFARFHLGDGRAPDGTPLLDPGVFKQMRAPRVPVDAGGKSMGLGWFTWEMGGERVAGYYGFLPGSVCQVTIVPARGFACAVLTNGGPARLDVEVTRWVLKRFLGLETPDAPAALRADAELHEYAGRYVGVHLPFDLEVRPADGALEVRRVSRSEGARELSSGRYLFCGGDSVISQADLKGAPNDFVRRAGRIAWFRFGSTLFPRVADA